jgi:hypothetical protein
MISDPILLSMRLRRTFSCPVCIVGDFSVMGWDEEEAADRGRTWKSLELPLLAPTGNGSGRGGLDEVQANLPGKCCIPANAPGERYRVALQWSPRHMRLLPHVLNVPGREAIEMHPASRPSDLLGCIAIGLESTGVEPMHADEVVIMGSQMAFYRQFEPMYLHIAGLASGAVATREAEGMKPVEIGTLEISNDFLNSSSSS